MPFPFTGRIERVQRRNASFTANGRDYRVPGSPVALICFDGCADEYIDQALVKGVLPNIGKMCREGFRGRVRGALPSFTNVNNASIVTGRPPSVHGIGGNYFLDPATGDEVMMNSSRFLRCKTILAAASDAGLKVGFVTAKDKLREILSKGMTGIAFSAEKANQASLEMNGIDQVEQLVGRATPKIYSAEASLFVIAAGVSLLKAGLADFLYLSTTDYMQHKFDYDDPEIIEYYSAFDTLVGGLLDQGATVGITADHGMNAKQTPEGEPNVIYLESILREEFGDSVRVILPITDPYVAHHGALGSFAVVHLPRGVEAERVVRFLLSLPGVTEALESSVAATKLELPADRIGDMVVMSGRDVTLGRTPEAHDLSALEAGLRSHGGRYEEMVPLITSKPLNEAHRRLAAADPRNFDAFDFLLNGVQG